MKHFGSILIIIDLSALEHIRSPLVSKSTLVIMDKGDECHSFHFIHGDGKLNVAGIENFVKEVRLAEHGLSYAVISIMGPQSSGKSTLLNHLLGTNFREMDALKGRSQTTKGIWLAKSPIIEPCTLVMDLEGTDGSEREDDTAFERQSALFALAVSDIVIINMWCHDLGRVHAANKPLLKSIFQVMMRLFNPRKTTLMFVLRDKTRTPLENLEHVLREDIRKIWDSTPKPQAHKETPLSQFFNVEIVALSSYDETTKQFKEQEVASLRKRFFDSIAPGGLARDRVDIVPALGFSFSVQQIWKKIKENKDLDLPAHMIMVATVRCEDIANEKFASFVANEDWCRLDKAAQSHLVPGFGKELKLIIDACLSEYDAEATYFDEGVRFAKQKQLKDKLLQHVQLAYQSMLGHVRSRTLDKFKEAFYEDLNGGEVFSVAARDCTKSCMIEFDKGCADAIIEQANWDSFKERDKLQCDIDVHVVAVRDAKLSELTTQYEAKLNDALSGPVKSVFDNAGVDSWPVIRELLRCETKLAVSGFSHALSAFDIDEQTKDNLLETLGDYARGVVEAEVKEGARTILISMKDRFMTTFYHDSNSLGVWSGEEDIPAIAETSCSASLKLLSDMAAIRLDDDTDNIENTLFRALLPANKCTASCDPLSSSTWEEVPLSKTLITPVQCRSLWRQFNEETKYIVRQAMAAKEAIEQANKQARELEQANEQAMELRRANEQANKRANKQAMELRRANERARELEGNNTWSLASWRLVGIVVAIVTASADIVGS